MLVVAALGGNALLKRGEPMTIKQQRDNVRVAAKALAEVTAAGHRLVVTHGNGPQVGMLALQGAAYKLEDAYPLDVLGAETEGMIGYLIEQELENALESNSMVATLLTQVEVDPNDPAFKSPTKFIGPIYDDDAARDAAAAVGWTMAQDGDKWRRVVPSPRPVRIPDVGVIKLLLNNDVTVICTGGGGIPVVKRGDGSYIGVEAVIDKDHASSLLARELQADALLLLTDVDAVYRNWGTPGEMPIHSLSISDIDDLQLPAGSMRPKVEAAARFAQSGGLLAGIGALPDALAILEERAGTQLLTAR